MSDTHGGKREGSGRPTNETRGLSPALSEVACCRVEPELKEWLKENGGAALHYQILKAAYDNR